MSESLPLVSVCIPTYQGVRFLGEAIDSALAQTYPHLEVVVGDNASTDGTDALLARYDDPRLRVLRRPETVDLAHNWRDTTQAARGEYVKLLCADDVLAPDALARQVPVLRDRPDVALVAARRALIDADSRVLVRSFGLRGLLGERTGRDVVRTVVRRGGINVVGEPAAVLFRRRDYEAVGGWDGDVVYLMDLALWIALLRRGGLVGQPAELAAFRIRDGAVSAAHSRSQYAELTGYLTAVAADPHWRLPWTDQVATRVSRPLMWRTWPRRKQAMRPGERWAPTA